MGNGTQQNRCQQCGLELYEGEKRCPYCGKKAWGISMIPWFIVFFLLFWLILALGR